jgi:hypothetical protein
LLLSQPLSILQLKKAYSLLNKAQRFS